MTRFKISRTSDWDEKPCEESYRSMHAHWEVRTCTEEAFDRKFSDREGTWRSRGISHSECHEGKHICRRMLGREEWTVSLNSLEELLMFSRKYGQLVIRSSDHDLPEESPIIEIYDSYRE